MRIRTQFIATMLLFGAVLVAISASAIITNRQISELNEQKEIASRIAQGASELSYLSNDYVIYRESQQLERWRTRFATFSADVSRLQTEKPEHLALVRNIQANTQRLKEVFESVVSNFAGPPRNQGGTVDLELLRVSWSRMAVQGQALASDASRLWLLLADQVSQSNHMNTIVVVALIGVFLAYFLVNYFTTQRRVLKGIATLQTGTAVIGSGNLNFSIEERRNDEIGDLSRAFNRMTADLKTVTASKTDLEREIVERKRAEDALRKALAEAEEGKRILDAIMENVPEGLTIADATGGTIRMVSKYGQRLIGAHDGITMKEYGERFSQRHADGTPYGNDELPLSRSMLRGEVIIDEEVLLELPGGRVIPLLCNSGPVSDRSGAIVGGVVAWRDITRLKEAQKDLEGFAYSVSHDLRAPLRAIDGFVRILLRDHVDRLDEEARRKFNMVRDNARKMGQLIDDLLLFSRVGRSALRYSHVDMTRLVSEVVAETGAADVEGGYDIRVGELPEAYADRALIRQVMVNLLSNAVKFSRDNRGSPIEIGALQESGEWAYYVKDCGVGFDMRYYNKLFGVFQRLHSEEQFEGTGVGLAIVNRIVCRHGGRVWAEGKPGEGATFYFTLPKETK